MDDAVLVRARKQQQDRETETIGAVENDQTAWTEEHDGVLGAPPAAAAAEVERPHQQRQRHRKRRGRALPTRGNEPAAMGIVELRPLDDMSCIRV